MKEQLTIIDAKKKWIDINLKELIQYKDLFLTMAYREFRVRYAQTFLGFLWAFLQPLATLLIFTFVFGKAIEVKTGEIPYPVFAILGLTAWSYFSFVVGQSGRSLINAQAMIHKIYFPRLILPLSKAIVGLIDFLITFLIMIVLLFYYGVSPSSNIVWLPLFVIMIIVSSLAIGIWVSALSIRYRDFQHMIPFLIQIGLYATPVAYPMTYIPAKYMLAYHIVNPTAGVVEGVRWSIVGAGAPSPYVFISLGIMLFLFFTSLIYFSRVEKTMADII